MYKAILLVAALFVPMPLVAQRLAPVPAYARASLPPISDAPRFDQVIRDSTIPPTYWLEGGIIGGTAVGLLAALWFRGMGESGNRTAGTVAGFVLGAAVGFPAGALIGGQFRKSTHTGGSS